MPPPRWIDVLGVRSIGPINPIAKDVLANHSRAPGPNRGPIRWGDTVLGSLSIEEAYLDPLRATARSENDGLRVLEKYMIAVAKPECPRFLQHKSIALR